MLLREYPADVSMSVPEKHLFSQQSSHLQNKLFIPLVQLCSLLAVACTRKVLLREISCGKSADAFGWVTSQFLLIQSDLFSCIYSQQFCAAMKVWFLRVTSTYVYFSFNDFIFLPLVVCHQKPSAEKEAWVTKEALVGLGWGEILGKKKELLLWTLPYNNLSIWKDSAWSEKDDGGFSASLICPACVFVY